MTGTWSPAEWASMNQGGTSAADSPPIRAPADVPTMYSAVPGSHPVLARQRVKSSGEPGAAEHAAGAEDNADPHRGSCGGTRSLRRGTPLVVGLADETAGAGYLALNLLVVVITAGTSAPRPSRPTRRGNVRPEKDPIKTISCRDEHDRRAARWRRPADGGLGVSAHDSAPPRLRRFALS